MPDPLLGPAVNNHRIVEVVYMSKKATALFTQREQNAIMGEGARVMGEAWIVAFLPKRFTSYARRLGYRVTAKYQKMKEKIMGAANALPLIGPRLDQGGMIRGRSGLFKKKGVQYYGAPLIQTAMGAHAVGTSTKGGARATIRIPVDHPINGVVSETLRTIPEEEYNYCAKIFGQTVTGYVNGAGMTNMTTGRMSLNSAARRSLNVGRKTAAAKAKFSRAKQKSA